MATFQPFYVQKPSTPTSVLPPRRSSPSLSSSRTRFLTKGLMMQLPEKEVRRYALMCGAPTTSTTTKAEMVNTIFGIRRLVVRLNMKRERSFRVPTIEKTILKNRAIQPSNASALQIQASDRTMRPNKQRIVEKAREVEKQALLNWLLGSENEDPVASIGGQSNSNDALFNGRATPVSAPAPLAASSSKPAPSVLQTPPASPSNLVTIRPLTPNASISPVRETYVFLKSASHAAKTPGRAASKPAATFSLPTPPKTPAPAAMPATSFPRDISTIEETSSSTPDQIVDADSSSEAGPPSGRNGLFGVFYNDEENPFAGSSSQGYEGQNGGGGNGSGNGNGGSSGSGGPGGPPGGDDDDGDDGDDGDDEDDEGDENNDEEEDDEGRDDDGHEAGNDLFVAERDDWASSVAGVDNVEREEYPQDLTRDIPTLLLDSVRDAPLHDVPLVYPPPARLTADNADWLELMFNRVRRERTNLVSSYDEARAQLAEALAEAQVVEAELFEEQELMRKHLNSIRGIAGPDVMEEVWGLVWENKDLEEEARQEEKRKAEAVRWNGQTRSRRHVQGLVAPPRASPQPMSSSGSSFCHTSCEESSSSSSGPEDDSPALRANSARAGNKRRRAPSGPLATSATVATSHPRHSDRSNAVVAHDRTSSPEPQPPSPKRPRLMRSNAVEINADGVDIALRNRLVREAEVPFDVATRMARNPPANYWQMPPEVASLPPRGYEATRILEDDGTPSPPDSPAAGGQNAGGSAAVAGPSTEVASPRAPPRVFHLPTPGRQWRAALLSSETATLNNGTGTSQVQRRVFYPRPVQTEPQAGPATTTTTAVQSTPEPEPTQPAAESTAETTAGPSQARTYSYPRPHLAASNENNSEAGPSRPIPRISELPEHESWTAYFDRVVEEGMSSSPVRHQVPAAEQEVAPASGAEQEEEGSSHAAAQQEEAGQDEEGDTGVIGSISAVMNRFLSRTTHPFFLGISTATEAENGGQATGDVSDAPSDLNQTAYEREHDAEVLGGNDELYPLSGPLV